MPVINPAMMKFVMLLLGSLLVLSPIQFDNNSEITVLHEIESHYEVQIPTQDKGWITLYVNRYGYIWGHEQIVPIDGIFIIDKNGKRLYEFDILNEDIDKPEKVRDDFASFFQQLPKDKKDLIAPWLEKAVRDYDGLLKELEKKAKK